MANSDKLSIRIVYDENTGLSLKEFNNYLAGLNTAYNSFTNKDRN